MGIQLLNHTGPGSQGNIRTVSSQVTVIRKSETVVYTLSGKMDWKCGVVGTKLIAASKPDS